MPENIGNLVVTALNGAIDDNDLTAVVDSSAGMPDAAFRLVIQDGADDTANREIVRVTNVAANTLTIERGMEGTTPVAHADNSFVAHVLTAGALASMFDDAASQAYVGKNAIGASITAMDTRRFYCQRIIVTTACFLVDIEGYVHNDASQVASFNVGLFDDSGGVPAKMLAFTGPNTSDQVYFGTGSVPRWVGNAVGYWLEPGTYWIGVQMIDSGANLNLAHDASGGVCAHFLAGGDWVSDGVSPTTTTVDYSIRANVLYLPSSAGVVPAAGVRVKRNADQAITSPGTAISWDTVEKDNGSYWNSAQPTRLTARVAGWYLVGGRGNSGVSSEDSTSLYLRKNGTTILDFDRHYETTDGVVFHVQGVTAVFLAAGDYIEMVVNVGASETVSGENGAELGGRAGALNMWMIRLSAADVGQAQSVIFDLLHSEKTAADTPDDEFEQRHARREVDGDGRSAGIVGQFMETGNVNKYDLSTRPGWLLMQAGVAVSVRLRQLFTLPDGASIVVPISVSSPAGAGDNQQVGVQLNTSDTLSGGTYINAFLEQDTGGEFVVQGNSSADTTGVEVLDEGYDIPRIVYLRIARVGLNYRVFVSWDGTSWFFIFAQEFGAAATRLWLFFDGPSSAKNTYAAIAAVPWIRQGGNGLDPWSPFISGYVP